jgi:hypothetical protein
MITRNDMLPMLLVACPSFQAVWDNMPSPEKKTVLAYGMGSFAKHLVHLHEQNQRESFQSIAKVVEQFRLEGDEDVRRIVPMIERAIGYIYSPSNPAK